MFARTTRPHSRPTAGSDLSSTSGSRSASPIDSARRGPTWPHRSVVCSTAGSIETTMTDTIPVATAGTAGLPAHDLTDLGLASEGIRRIEWAEREMPVLRLIRERFERERPLDGIRIGACLHVTTETANLMRTLKAGGADVVLAASNPLSTKDDVAAALVAEYGIPPYAKPGEDRDTYYAHLTAVADTKPQLTMDDGCDLVSLLHAERAAQLADVLAGTEETTTGVIPLRAMGADGG